MLLNQIVDSFATGDDREDDSYSSAKEPLGASTSFQKKNSGKIKNAEQRLGDDDDLLQSSYIQRMKNDDEEDDDELLIKDEDDEGCASEDEISRTEGEVATTGQNAPANAIEYLHEPMLTITERNEGSEFTCTQYVQSVSGDKESHRGSVNNSLLGKNNLTFLRNTSVSKNGNTPR
jgi:hypothetical protein